MKKWTVLERAQTPDKSTMTLSEHDGEFVLRVNGRALMSTARHASELRLGELGGLATAGRAGARVLVGGLGLGFTLRGALATARADAQVVLAELLAEVVAWNENPAYPLASEALRDPRTRVIHGDVFDVIAAAARAPGDAFDAILLDADNDTTSMMSAGNKRLYTQAGVRRVRKALRPRGTVVYWSVGPEPALEQTLRKLGFAVSVEKVRAYGHGGDRHHLILGTVAHE